MSDLHNGCISCGSSYSLQSVGACQSTLTATHPKSWQVVTVTVVKFILQESFSFAICEFIAAINILYSIGIAVCKHINLCWNPS